ncbi:MAG: ABC transporter substrate-binding protein [Brevibacterium sp.]
MKSRLIGATVVALLALSGCGSGSGDANGDDTLRITWWGNGQRAEATQEALDLFEKNNPDIKVEALPSTFDGYYNKLTTQFAAKSAPDIFQDDQVRTFADKGLLLDLNDTEIDLSTIDPAILKQGTVDDKVYEVPAGTSPMSFVYKTQMLKDAGVETPNADTSWDDLITIAEKLQPKLPEGTHALADSSTQANHFEVFLRQRGKGWFNEDGTAIGFDEKDLADWWTYWEEVRDKELTTPVDQSIAGSGGDVAENPVAKDLVAMGIYGTAVSLPNEEWEYGSIPGEAGNPGVYQMRSSSWAINSKTENPEEAAKLVDFLINDDEAASALGLSRGVPGSEPAKESAGKDAGDKDKFILDYSDYLAEDGNSGTGPAPDPAGTRSLRSDIFVRYAQKVLFKEMSVEDGAAAATKEANALLDSIK